MNSLLRERSTPSSLSLRAVLLILLIATAPSPILHAAPPGWWYDRGVIDDTHQPNEYAAANQGQAKFIAEQAAEELDAHLPGGAGEAVRQMVNAWETPTATTNDYTVINLGQLKKLAQPFYDRLKAVAYTTVYPWAGHESLANDYAAANIGQVKNLFSFDLTSTDAAHDANGDGLPDWWENFYGLNGVNATGALSWNPNLTYLQALQQGLNPVDFYGGHAPTFAAYSGDGQHGAPGEFVGLPLTVSVVANGQPLINAPVKFTVAQGAGQLQRSSKGPASQSLTVLTDYSGQASVFFKLSGVASDPNQVTATPGSGTYSVSQSFTATANLAAGTHPSPFDPTNVTATLNRDGSMDVTWTNHADPDDTDTINVQGFDANGVYHTIATAPAGATSCTIPAP